MAIDAEAKVRRALRSKTRDVYSEIVETGDFVYYKRDGSKRWRGPATVTGRDGKIVILRHGGYPIKCHLVQVINVNDLYNIDSPPAKSDLSFDTNSFPHEKES